MAPPPRQLARPGERTGSRSGARQHNFTQFGTFVYLRRFVGLLGRTRQNKYMIKISGVTHACLHLPNRFFSFVFTSSARCSLLVLLLQKLQDSLVVKGLLLYGVRARCSAAILLFLNPARLFVRG